MPYPDCSDGWPDDVIVNELFSTGNLEFGATAETRIREFVAYSPGGTVIQTHDVLNTECAKATGSVPQYQDPWGDLDGGPYTSVSSLPEVSTTLTVSRVNAWQLTPAAVRITVVYSTDPSAWTVKKQIEFTTVSSRVYYDYDFKDGLEAPPMDLPIPGCIGWDDMPGQGTNPKNSLINGLEGVATISPRYLIIYSGMFALEQSDLNTIGSAVGTLNEKDHSDQGFVGIQKWLFNGASGPELRPVTEPPTPISKRLYQLEFRFEYSPAAHRGIYGVTSEGNLSGVPNPGGGLEGMLCRHARIHPIQDWASWVPTLFGP